MTNASKIIFCFAVGGMVLANFQDTLQANDFDSLRRRMVDEQITARGIRDQKVIETMLKVPRHEFVAESFQKEAYGDYPLPIGYGQTISQPYIVAFMTQAAALTPEDKVLEIGTGSGYQAAVLADISAEVYTIEIVEGLVKEAQERLTRLGYKNIYVKHGDGYLGWPEEAPFDAIVVTAAPERIPQKLIEQLKVGGRMVIPVGSFFQELYLITKSPTGIERVKLLPVRFVPMIHSPDGRDK